MADYTIKQGDLLPSIEGVCTDAAGPVDLTAADAVRFHLRALGSDPTADPTVDADAVVVDADAGLVRYDWQDGDTDLPGYYRAEFEVTSAGKPTTFPNNTDTIVHIRPAVA